MGFNKEEDNGGQRRQSCIDSDMAAQNESLYAGASFRFDQDDAMCFGNANLQEKASAAFNP